MENLPNSRRLKAILVAIALLVVGLILLSRQFQWPAADWWSVRKKSSQPAESELQEQAQSSASFYQQHPHLVQPLPSATPPIMVTEADLFNRADLFASQSNQSDQADRSVVKFVVTAVEGNKIVAQGVGSGQNGQVKRSQSREFVLGKNASAYLVRRGAESKDKLILRMAPANALVTGLEKGAVLRVEMATQEGVKDKIYYLEE